jgi:hypothetical protein
MTKTALLTLGLTLIHALAGCAAPPPVREAAEPPAGEVAAALAGRTAAGTTSCVGSQDLRGSHSLGGGEAILFETRGRLVYVNRPRGGCAGLRPDLAIRTSSQSARLCEGDVIQGFDALTGVAHASCSLGAFTAYRPVR